MDELIKKNFVNFDSAFIVEKLKQHKTPIGIAISLVILRSIYEKLFKPPKRLRHIPYTNPLIYMKNLVQGTPYSTMATNLHLPLYEKKNKGEIYLRPDILGWTLCIANPEDAKQVLLKTDIFNKAPPFLKEGTVIYNYYGNDNIVIISDKHDWLRHRMTVNPAFKAQKPLRLFAEYTHRVFDVIDNNNGLAVDFKSLMEKFALDIIGKAGFDFEFNSLKNKNDEMVNMYHEIKKGVDDPPFLFFPFLDTKLSWLFPRRRYLQGLVKKFHTMLDEVIENKRRILKNQKVKSNIDDSEKDILTLMLESELSGQKVLTDSEIKSDLNIFFLAGHDTTANSLASAIYYLAKHQDMQQRAREEAISIFGDEPVNVFPTDDELKKLEYINQIIKETLRISGPVPHVSPRINAKDTILSGTFIPKNTPIAVSLFDIHHNSKVWENPYTFNPERFAGGGEAVQNEREGLSWLPFSSGPRICIGMSFSLAEQRIMLASILRKYEWHLPEDTIHKEELITTNTGLITPIDLKIVFKQRY
ncbi:unnamed protein product [Cunninghamella blakesleeana]